MSLPSGVYVLSLYGTVNYPGTPVSLGSSAITHVDSQGNFVMLRKTGSINGDYPGDFSLWRGATAPGTTELVADSGMDLGYSEAHLGFFAGSVNRGHIDRPSYIWQRNGDKAVVFHHGTGTRSLVDPLSDSFLFSGTQWNLSSGGGIAKHGRAYLVGGFEDSYNDNYLMLWSNLPPELGTKSAFVPGVVKKNVFGAVEDVGLNANFGYIVNSSGVLYKLNKYTLSVVDQISLVESGWRSYDYQMVIHDDSLIWLLNLNNSGTQFRIRALNDFSSFVSLGTVSTPASFGPTSFQYREINGQGLFYTHNNNSVPTYIWQFSPIFDEVPPPKAWCK